MQAVDFERQGLGAGKVGGRRLGFDVSQGRHVSQGAGEGLVFRCRVLSIRLPPIS